MREQVKERWGETLTRGQADRILAYHAGGDLALAHEYEALAASGSVNTDELFDWLGY